MDISVEYDQSSWLRYNLPRHADRDHPNERKQRCSKCRGLKSTAFIELHEKVCEATAIEVMQLIKEKDVSERLKYLSIHIPAGFVVDIQPCVDYKEQKSDLLE